MELVPVQEQEAVPRRQDGRLRPVGRESADERVDRLVLVRREALLRQALDVFRRIGAAEADDVARELITFSEAGPPA